MLAPEVRIRRLDRRFISTAVATGALLALACAHDARTRPASTSAAWIDTDLTGPPVAGQAPQLDGLAQADPTARVIRLDRLVDLVDAARFAEDAEARETLWEALGGHETGVGTEATRSALLLLLQEALAVENSPSLPREHRAVLGDLVMLLSADLGRTGTAEDLAVQTLAYRTLIEAGHPRVADNARWRLYDHVRGTLQGATEASNAVRRLEIAVHGLYVVEDDIAPWLEDRPPHSRPPWPSPLSLCGLLEDQREALAEIPRWASSTAERRADDRRLCTTVLATLPAPRDPRWPLATLAAGTGQPESFAPVVTVTDEAVTLDQGRPQARTLGLEAAPEEIAKAVQTALAVDGRGRILLVAPPLLPSPALGRILGATTLAALDRIELAVHEPRLQPQGGQPVVTMLPLEVFHPDDRQPWAQAFRAARLRIHLAGEGVRFAIDDVWLPDAAPSDPPLSQSLERLHRAYPGETMVALTVGGDVLYQQLLELVTNLLGGPNPPFLAVGLTTRPKPPAEVSESSAAARERLQRRLALAGPWPKPRLEQPYPLRSMDQVALEHLADELQSCLPELELPNGLRRPVAVQLVFNDGLVAETRPVWPARLPDPRRDAALACFEQQSYGTRLTQHRDRVEVTVELGPIGP